MRPSRSNLRAVIPLTDAQARVLATVAPLPPVTVPLREALGLALSEPLAANEPVPPFDNTAVDGYAVQAGDTAGASAESPVRLVVVDEVPAGKAPSVPVGRGEAIRIMTGAPVPPGAAAVGAGNHGGQPGQDSHSQHQCQSAHGPSNVSRP